MIDHEKGLIQKLDVVSTRGVGFWAKEKECHQQTRRANTLEAFFWSKVLGNRRGAGALGALGGEKHCGTIHETIKAARSGGKAKVILKKRLKESYMGKKWKTADALRGGNLSVTCPNTCKQMSGKTTKVVIRIEKRLRNTPGVSGASVKEENITAGNVGKDVVLDGRGGKRGKNICGWGGLIEKRGDRRASITGGHRGS